MNWRGSLIRFVDKQIKHNHIHDNLAQLKEFYRLPPEEQQKICQERLVNLLNHAAQHVPYYARVLRESGVFVNSNIDLTNFNHIPFLTKDILRNQFEKLKSDDLHKRRWKKNTSGGSTGEPVVFLQDSHYSDMSLATKRWQYEQVGLQLGDVHIKLWGSERDIIVGSESIRTKMANSVRNRTFLNAFRMSEKDMARYTRYIQLKKPVLIEAYVQSAYELAKYINSENIKISGVGAVMTSAGNLLPFMRREIEQAFHCSVFNRYGSREVGDMACEFRDHDGLHVSHYTHWIEIIGPDGEPVQPGSKGEIVVTCLSNYAMPLIRYRIGDIGIPATINKSFTPHVVKLKAVTGRTVDVFITVDGTKVDGEYFTHLIYFRSWVKKFQFIQESYNTILLNIVKNNGSVVAEQELTEIQDKIKLVMGQACKVRINFVSNILAGDSGKYRYTISQVDDSRQATSKTDTI